MRVGINRKGLAMVIGMSVAILAADVMAQSYGSWGSSGSYGSYGSSASYGSSGSSASYGSYGSSGSHGGLFARMRARRAARASYGSSGSSASYGSYGSSGSSGGYAYSYGSSGSSGGYAYSSSGSSGSYSAGYAADTSDMTASTGDASIKVSLPAADAKVLVNGAPTTSTGAERSYVSHGLHQGLTYSYSIRVEYQKDGKPVTEDKVVKLAAGKSVSVTFGATKPEDVSAEISEPAVQTEVKVQVPAEAKVFLSGAATKQTGEVRVFSTSQLAPGQQWDNYTVRVEVERDGQTLVREKTLTVTGGDSYELAFDFDSAAPPQLAQLDR